MTLNIGMVGKNGLTAPGELGVNHHIDAENIVGKYYSDDEIYHDLMQYKIGEILLVATKYDAFILQQEGQLTEVIFNDYFTLNLSSAPRITSVPTARQAQSKLKSKRFDLVVVMMRIPDMTPFQLSKKIKAAYPDLPVLLLLKDNAEISLLSKFKDRLTSFDNVFVWNSDSKIFVAMVKCVEDRINADNDTRIGMVRIVLLIEDSIRYCSRYLPILYIEIIKQTQQLISQESPYEQKKLLRMRARPKVLVAKNYEEAVEVINKYRDYLLCVISDVKYKKDGVMDERAGVKLIQHVRSTLKDLPSVLQSSEPENEKEAIRLQSRFIDKNSPTLSQDLVSFFIENLGFGDFVMRDADGKEITRAESMDEIRGLLETVPLESLKYHGSRNHFSAWLMARGEIQIAKKLQPIKISEFESLDDLRTFLVTVFQRVHYEATRGKVVAFDESNLLGKNHVIRMSNGSMGGKGRGIAFIGYLIENGFLPGRVDGVNIRVPQSSIIGTEEFDRFMAMHTPMDVCLKNNDYEAVKACFLSRPLSKDLTERLKIFLRHIHHPVAVRSSSLLEDSLSQPFSGVYSTYLLPNNHPDLNVRLKQLEDAVKLIYASVFSRPAKAYFDAINYKIEEEKMAVIIQEVVGQRIDEYYYPHCSGVAQSYNYYPVSYMKPGDGITMLAAGLGKYVVEGEKSHHFCPVHPRLDILAPEDQIKNSQNHLYAVDMHHRVVDLIDGEDSTLITLNLQDAEKHGMLNMIASVWNADNNRIQPGLDFPGPRIINFEYILKYDLFPLAKIIRDVLNTLKDQLGTAVEIEFAIDLGNGEGETPCFYLLQIKHFMRNLSRFSIDPDKINRDDLWLYTSRGMGNGRLDGIQDIIYIDPDVFDRSRMGEMTSELEQLNRKLKAEDRKYILIGPGRWGTRDKWLGISITWAQISNAKIIIEAGLEDFQVDASMGSHFFHNITSMNVGYFSVPFGLRDTFIDWEWLKSLAVMERTTHCVHIHTATPLPIHMDGRKGISLIYKHPKK
jgi:CheY-like chemotaxis protein